MLIVRRLLSLFALPLLFAAGLPAGVSASDPIVQGDDGARDVLRRAMVALGGPELLSARGTVTFTHTGTARSVEQARSPRDATSTDPRELHYVIDMAASRLRLDSRTRFAGDLMLSTRLVLEPEGGYQIDLLRWALGTDVIRLPAAVVAPNFAAGTRVLPHLLLLQAMSHDSTLADHGIVELDGERQRVIGYRDVSGADVRVHLDAATHLVRRYEVRRGEARSDVYFHDYRVVDGLRVPHHSRSVVNGRPGDSLHVTRISFSAVPASAFAVPAGYADPPPGSGPRVEALAPSVYSLEGMPAGYRSLFVDAGDHVVVLEAPQSVAFAEQALQLIEEALPGKPVRYVLVTHHHADHVAGLAPYVERGAIIVAGSETDVALRRQLGTLGEKAVIEMVRGKRTMGSGSTRIDLIEVPNPHADGSLIFHFPAHGILVQADLLYVPERGPLPAAFPAATSLRQAIAARSLNVQRIIGVHGRPATVAELEEAIRLAN